MKRDTKAYDKLRYTKAKAEPFYSLQRRLKTLELKIEVFRAYGGCFCRCCGEKELTFLELDHVNNNGAAHRKAICGKSNGVGNRIYRELKKRRFPPGFQVLCTNCNKGKYRFGGTCPHKLLLESIDEGEYIDMGWEQISLQDVPVEETTKLAPVPAGTYVLQVIGAEEGKFRPGSLNISLAIADEGPYAGRRVFVDLPDVNAQPWVAKIVAQMVKSMGAEFPPYGNPIEEFNRIASNGHSRFQADVAIETFKRNDGSEGTKNKVNYRSIRPAA